MKDANSARVVGARRLGLDLTTDLVRRARKLLYKPEVARKARKLAKGRLSKAAETRMGLDSTMPDVLEAREVNTTSGTFGYVRIRSFNVDDDGAFLLEFIRLVAQLPQNGLIVDVRGNGGGLIPASERLLQTLTPNSIDPETFQFISSPRIIVNPTGALRLGSTP